MTAEYLFLNDYPTGKSPNFSDYRRKLKRRRRSELLLFVRETPRWYFPDVEAVEFARCMLPLCYDSDTVCGNLTLISRLKIQCIQSH